ncbi:putative AdoMet-dependent rRNA methyltransferase spb1 [Blattamonas nauphoetae]|uniref:Putative tRNA (cytidine(32)/guanosine(34)-2'-O)-methyltransferase n=1 Tax=Blattamonas nauphoetae TaxID=2049346 RepID=A0ABQ9XGL8_9EUKA|nr:putative AdoMet-dependent rRNA methyltransferase spb1 [Blattamonas nauphoetae]
MGRSSKDKRDIFYRKAKEEGFRARSAFKLLQIDQEFRLFDGVTNVVDLCAAPGSWSQVCSQRLAEHPNAHIVAIDLNEILPIPGVTILRGDITSPTTIENIINACEGNKVDLVLSDGAPDVTGLHDLDQYMQQQLILAALTVSTQLLRPGGKLCAKIFRGKDVGFMYSQLRVFFDDVIVAKPQSSRNSSIESFIVCQGFHLPEGYPPILIDSTQPRYGLPPTTDSVLVPFVACGDLSGFDSDQAYLPTHNHSLLPVAPPVDPPYRESVVNLSSPPLPFFERTMKIKAISRLTPEKPILRRNIDPTLHPLARGREAQRATVAAKWDRIFAKPFVGALSGHYDGVWSLTRHPRRLNCVLSGSCDGEIRIWNTANKTTIKAFHAHEGFVRGLCFPGSGDRLLSCSDDRTIKIWRSDLWTQGDTLSQSIAALVERTKEAEEFTQLGEVLTEPTDDFDDESSEESDGETVRRPLPGSAEATAELTEVPISTILGTTAFTSLAHHWEKPQFITTGGSVDLWTEERTSPLESFAWGAESVYHAAFNRVEKDTFVTCGSDRSIVLYDLRDKTPIRKQIMHMRTNCVCWNPQEAFNFIAGNEDGNIYEYDMRKLSFARNVYKDHLDAVMSVDFCPTGRSFASGSYDRTVRMWNVGQGKSRDVYHLKRMQRVFVVTYTGDGQFVLSGSDDANVRLWKAHSSDPLYTMVGREKQKLNYLRRLQEKHKDLPEVKQISQARHLPHQLHSKVIKQRIREEADKRRVDNILRHSKPGSEKVEPERMASIVEEEQ